MSLLPRVAARLLRARLNTPTNPVPKGDRAGQDNQKVIGFATPGGRVLALHDEIDEATRIWFQPPAPPAMAGITLLSKVPINANLSGRLAILNQRQGLYAEIDTEGALGAFIDWYAGADAAPARAAGAPLDAATFRLAFARFQRLIAANDKGHAFTNFEEGISGVWENYKQRLRDHALRLLAADTWTVADIGSGKILQRVIDAIEIDNKRANVENNLVMWNNRYGHASRDHRMLLEAVGNTARRRELEQQLFGLYRGDADVGETFTRLSELTSAKYPLIGYLFFLKDMDRFMPILPTTFDHAFRELGIDLVTRGRCSWENYQQFNSALAIVQTALSTTDGLSKVRLIDAHSFCWMLIKMTDDSGQGSRTGKPDAGRILGSREKSIITMCMTIEGTARYANGQLAERTVKNKDLRMTPAELQALLTRLMDIQENRCALTGIPFHFLSPDADKRLLPSADRIDSSGHYEDGNIQLVCQFINFWKSTDTNEEFLRLLMLVRGVEPQDG